MRLQLGCERGGLKVIGRENKRQVVGGVDHVPHFKKHGPTHPPLLKPKVQMNKI